MSQRRLQLDAFLPYRLSVTSNAVSRLIAQAYEARFGLSIPEWRLIAILGESRNQALTQRGLVRRTGMDKVAVSRAAARLLARGLAEASSEVGDARARPIRLTAIGGSVYAEIAPLALAMEERLLSTLSRKEREALAEMLGRIQAQAQTMLGESAVET